MSQCRVLTLVLICLVLVPAASRAESPSPERMAALVEQLASDNFSLREDAGKELQALGTAAISALREAAKSHDELEVRFRAQELLAQIQRHLFAEVASMSGHNRFPRDVARGWVTRSASSPDGQRLFTIAGDSLREWNLDSRTAVRSLGSFEGLYFALALSRTGERALTGVANDWSLAVWDLNAGRELVRLKGHTSQVWGATFSADGKQAITAGWDKSIRVWDLMTGQELRQFEGVIDNVRCLALSRDGTRLAAGHFGEPGQPGILRIWDVASGKEQRAMPGHTLEITSVSFSPDDRQVLTSSFDGTLRLWELSTGKSIREFKGHSGRIEAAAFSPDGSYVYSVADESDRTLRIWLAESGEDVFKSNPQPNGLLSVTPLADNRRVVTTSKDGVIKIWQWNH